MASTYLNKTFSTSGTSDKIKTFSFWLKKATSSTEAVIISAGSATRDFIRFESTGELRVRLSGGSADLITTQLFRDTSAWYHIVIAFDTPQATSSNRIKIYVNGSQVTALGTATYPSQNATIKLGTNNPNHIGNDSEQTTPYFDGLMTSVYLIDGTALDATSFGQTDATTGIWKFKSYSGSYGTNGFFLKFENSGSLGTDSSGNGNNFTVNGTPTQTVDTPSNVFATFNAVDKSGGTVTTFSNGNLNVKHANGTNGAVCAERSTIAVSKGKWYWEAKCISTGGDVRIGIISMSSSNYATAANPYILNDCYNYKQNGVKGSSSADTAYGATYTANDILGVAYDADNGSLTFYKNGTSQGVAFSSLDTSFTWGAWSTEYDGGEYAYNFGNGRFGTTAISSPYSDGAGLGKFQYQPPTGYYALCTKNINVYG